MPSLSIPFLTLDDRHWRIDWFGELSFPGGTNRRSQASIRVAVSPLNCDKADNQALLSTDGTDHHHQKLRWLPVSMLPYVQVGDIWQNGQAIYVPEYQREKFIGLEISKETTDFIKAGLAIEDAFILPLSQHPWHRNQTQSYCVNVALPNEKRLVIPCIELIRFYFGSSGNLLHRLFSTQIAFDPLWKSKHFDPIAEKLHLKLADGISGASASDIGRIALDNEAMYSARKIFDTCLLSLLDHKPVYTYTGFPFTGKTNLVASGKWLSYGTKDDSTFLVYRLESCSHPFPFKSLSYEVSESTKLRMQKNKSAKLSEDAEEQKVQGTGYISGKQTLSEDDPGNSRSSKEHKIKVHPRFPDLSSKMVWRERYDTVDAPEILQTKSLVDEEISVGTQIGNSKVRAVDITFHTSTEIDTKTSRLPKFVRDGIKTAIKNANLNSKNVKTSLITLSGYSNPVISLPYLVDEDGEINQISFYSNGYGEQRMRRACFAEIKEGEFTYYRVFVVEPEIPMGEIFLIDVQEFDLKKGMIRLIVAIKNIGSN
jgi:hypothetical protein